MKKPLLAACVATPLACLSSLSVAHMLDIPWTEAGRYEHRVSVAPGKFAELCTKLASGQPVQWSFQASAALDFNIHYHQGAQVEFPAKAAGLKSAEGLLAPASAQDYCWMWSNKSAQSLELSVQMSK